MSLRFLIIFYICTKINGKYGGWQRIGKDGRAKDDYAKDGRTKDGRIEGAAELGCYYLVGVAFLASEGVGDGFKDNLDVEKETPVFYIPDVFLDTFFHHP